MIGSTRRNFTAVIEIQLSTPKGGLVRHSNIESGYAMAGLLVSVFVISLMMAIALPVWHHAAKREREAELIFRGEQYARAVALWQRQRPGSAPPDLDTLVEQRYLRKKYRDPMVEDGEFRLVLQSELAAVPAVGRMTTGMGQQFRRETSREGQSPGETFGIGAGSPGRQPEQIGSTSRSAPGGVAGGIVGVVSTSDEISIAIYDGRSKYSEWYFVFPADAQVGVVSVQPATVGAGFSGEAMPGAGTARSEIRRRPAP